MNREELQSSGVERERRVSLAYAISRLTLQPEQPFAKVFEHGSLVVEILAPRGKDTQQPHKRDEVYIVMRGSGEFWNGELRQRVVAGDLLFVAAGIEHRFENFTDDLALWVIFYGPDGGEG